MLIYGMMEFVNLCKVMVCQFLRIVVKKFFISNPIIKINTLKYENVNDVSSSVHPYILFIDWLISVENIEV